MITFIPRQWTREMFKVWFDKHVRETGKYGHIEQDAAGNIYVVDCI